MRAFGRLAIATLLLAGGALPATAAVPTLLLDIRDSGVADPDDSGIEGRFLSLGDRALVPVREPSSGRELWVTDGTDVGTRPLRDFCLGACASDFDLLGAVGGVGVFLVYPNGISQEPSLWRSDGTRSGTSVLAGPGQAPGRCALSTAPESAVLGGNLLFSGRTDAGCDLWKTDGTVAGTVRLKEITPHVLHEMTKVGGRVFFAAPDFDGWGLWASNGTAAGTVRLRSFSGEPSTLVAAGSRLFFAAPDEGLELWTSDGTVAGTRPVTRFGPVDPLVFHNESALDKRFVFQEIDGQLYFLANDGVTGREIWRSDGTAAGTRPVTSMSMRARSSACRPGGFRSSTGACCSRPTTA